MVLCWYTLHVELNYNIICYKTGAGLSFVGMYIYVNEDFLIVFAANT